MHQQAQFAVSFERYRSQQDMMSEMANTEPLQSSIDLATRYNNRVFHIYIALLIASGLIVALFTYLTWDAGNKVQDAVQKKATSEQQVLALKVAEQQERAAKAERDLAELQNKVRPRNLSKAQSDRLRMLLSGRPRGILFFSCNLGDGEASTFAKEIEAVLHDLGWSKDGVAPLIWSGKEPTGISLIMSSDINVPPYVTRLQNAFFAIGLPLPVIIEPQGEHGKVYLVVGHKL